MLFTKESSLPALLSIILVTLGSVELSSGSNETQTPPQQDSSPYVQVQWKRSEEDQSGHHSCTARNVDSNNEEITCTTQVKFRQNKVDNLLDKIQIIQERLSSLESKYDTCQHETRELTDRVNGLQSNLTANVVTVTTQGHVVNDLKIKLVETSENLDIVRNTLSSIRTEEGTVYCGGSNEFHLNTSEVLYNRVKYVRVNFNAAFNKIPQVTGSIRAVDADKSTNFRYNFQIRNVDALGFTLVCMTWSDTVLHGIDYQWRATTPLN